MQRQAISYPINIDDVWPLMVMSRGLQRLSLKCRSVPDIHQFGEIVQRFASLTHLRENFNTQAEDSASHIYLISQKLPALSFFPIRY